MIKIETHAHSFGSSWCAKASDEILIDKYINHGYDVLVLTNHLHKSDFSRYQGQTDKEKLDTYFSFIDKMKKKGKEKGLLILEGAEIDCVVPNGIIEFAVYGLPRKVFYEHNPLFTLTQKELFKLVEENKAFMYQTHPFRNGVLDRGDVKYLHGAESFNGHFHHENNNALAKAFCEENNLIKLSGTDFHHYDQLPTGGIKTNREIQSEKDLVDLCFSGDFELVELDELYRRTRQEYLEEIAKCK